MKKITLLSFLIIMFTSISSFADGPFFPMKSGESYRQIGNTTYGSDGTSYRKIGNTTYGSDGTSYRKIGKTT